MAAKVFAIYARGTLCASCARSNAMVDMDRNIWITLGLEDFSRAGFYLD